MIQAKPSRRDEDWPRRLKGYEKKSRSWRTLWRDKKLSPEYYAKKKKKSQRRISYGPPCIRANLCMLVNV